MNGSGPKRHANDQQLPTDPIPGIDPEQDALELRRERKRSSDALLELDDLLPDTLLEVDFDDETEAGQPKRRPITLTEAEPAFPSERPTTTGGAVASEVSKSLVRILRIFQNQWLQFALMAMVLTMTTIIVLAWILKSQTTILIGGKPATPAQVEEIKKPPSGVD